MKIENLTPQQTGTVESFLKELQKSNPHLGWHAYPMGEDTPHVTPHPIHHVVHPEISKDIEERLLLIEEKLDKLLSNLALVFGSHVLVNGRFVNIDNPPTG